MAAALPFISVAFSVMGAISQANTARQNAKAQQNAANYNAEVSRQQAQSALQVSTAQQLAQNRRARQIAGAGRAAVAQSGTGFGGSNQDVLDQSGTYAELDQLNLAYEGSMRARGWQSQAELDAYQGRVAGANAKRATAAGILGAGSAIAGGWSSMFPSSGTTARGSLVGGGLQPGGGIGLRYGGTRYG